MQVIRVEDAVGTVLCHDITRIVPDEFKGPAFRKGQIITEGDIPALLQLGKEHLYVWEPAEGEVHENDAGIRLAEAIKGQGIVLTQPHEGKVDLIAQWDGMCTIDEEMLIDLNMIEDIVVATRNHRRAVKKGDIIAGVRVVPLLIADEKLRQVERLCAGHEIVSIKPFRAFKVGVITTGSEVYYGRIQDKFGPVVKKKIEAFGCEVIRQILVPDDIEQIAAAIQALMEEGAELILTTGGMSVDPDDVTPSGVRAAGAEIVTYGAPVLPGAMMMVAYKEDIPILGLPGCVMYYKATIFDLLIPLVLTEVKIDRRMIARLGMGGLCLNCEVCRYPACSFGTGA